MILLAYAAPFAVFRDFTAGYLRSSYPFAPPSALYGLILNIAGVEMRGELGPGTTVTREGLPSFRIASAAVGVKTRDHSFGHLLEDRKMPGRGMLFQQLHTIPVGSSSKERKPLTKGNKHHIAPARREILSSFRGVCAVDASTEIETMILAGVDAPVGTLNDGQPRYGVPFLGDNNFFLEELSIAVPSAEAVDWLVKARKAETNDIEDLLGESSTQEDSFPFRLTLWADRTGMKDTRDAMFSLRSGTLDSPPEDSWVQVGPS